MTSLDAITINALRDRQYDSQIKVESLSHKSCVGGIKTESLPQQSGTYQSFMASFKSDGIRQYARITIPDGTPPAQGFPYIVFLHGYVGQEKAPNYSIGCSPGNLYYGELTDAFARAGYAVLSPGYRGHATVSGVPADGIEYLEAFDQGAGISTQFYAIDSLNFVAGVGNINGAQFPDHSFKFDSARFYLFGHSQGGDAALTYLAAVGEGNHNDLSPVKAAIWSGTFLDRLTALEKMMPVALTPEAFLSGDGSWTGTAFGAYGEVNPEFIFGYPPDWIESPDPKDWTWQVKTWSEPSVRTAIEKVTDKMYSDLSANVSDLQGIAFEIVEPAKEGRIVEHDPRIAAVFPKIGGYNSPEYLQEPLTLHVPDQDHYSQVSWNRDLCQRVNTAGGICDVIVYAHNNHSMRASPRNWFSPEGTKDGYPQMVKNLKESFSSAVQGSNETRP